MILFFVSIRRVDGTLGKEVSHLKGFDTWLLDLDFSFHCAHSLCYTHDCVLFFFLSVG